VQNVIIIQKAQTKLSVGQHAAQTKAKVRLSATRNKNRLVTGHTLRMPLVENKYMGLHVVKASIETTVLEKERNKEAHELTYITNSN
jgi:hypothetical protein